MTVCSLSTRARRALLALFALPAVANADFPVRMQTDLGALDILLLDSVAPLNVTNFMNYVGDGDYDNSFIHRMLRVPGSAATNPPFGTSSVVQGGSFVMTGQPGTFFNPGSVVQVPEDPPVVNEFGMSNVRGTLAMAKVPQEFDMNGNPVPGTGPDSATSGWFFNLTDNSSSFDTQNGGYTVFGQVQGTGMDVIDAIGSQATCTDVVPVLLCASLFVQVYALEAAFTGTASADNTVLVNVYIGTDNEGDGAIDRLEDAAPNGGDGNNDAIMDSQQAHVASYPGNGTDYSVVASPAVNPLSEFSHSDISYGYAHPGGKYDLIALALDNDMDMPGGFAGYDINGLAPGAATSVTLTLPAGATPDNFFVYGPTPGNATPHWYEFMFDATTGTGAQIAGNVVTLHFVDGQRGDADLDNSNGLIRVSPGGAGSVPVDLDGVDDAVEDAGPNGGDGNNDMIPDSLQGHVASLTEALPLGSTRTAEYVTIEAMQPAHRLHYIRATTVLPGQNNAAVVASFNFQNGLYEIHMTNVVPGGSAEVKMTLPPGTAPDAYFMYGPEPGNATDHWYRFDYDGTTGAILNGNVVTLHYVDGMRGDADLTINGIIADPGGPATAILNANLARTDGGGGGCSIASGRTVPAQAGAWWLLIAALAAFGVVRRRGGPG